MGKRVLVTYSEEARLGPYVDALLLAGMEPTSVKPGKSVEALGSFDGLLLSGGVDLNPELYGETPRPETQKPDNDRDNMELELLNEAMQLDLPVLAICRGLQLFNVAHGGSLVQHIADHAVRNRPVWQPVHEVQMAEGTRLRSILGETTGVNSRHHQAVARMGAGLIRSAVSAHDSVIEGLERPDRRFAVAVQWHPEDQVNHSPAQMALFTAFRDAL